MLISKQPYKCLKCGHELEYSPHYEHEAPATNDFIGCPKCWVEFLRSNIGELACTVDFSRDRSGSEYDKKRIEAQTCIMTVPGKL